MHANHILYKFSQLRILSDLIDTITSVYTNLTYKVNVVANHHH